MFLKDKVRKLYTIKRTLRNAAEAGWNYVFVAIVADCAQGNKSEQDTLKTLLQC